MATKQWPLWFKRSSRITLLIIVIATVIALGKTSKTQKTEQVTFCGKTYQIKPVFLNGVDLVQRVVEIEMYKSPEAFCRNLNNPPQNELLPLKLGKCKGYMNPQQCLQFGGGFYIFDPVSRNIYIPGFDGRVFYGNF